MHPLQCSCLENPRMGEPGRLPSTGSQSRTRLKRLSSSSRLCPGDTVYTHTLSHFKPPAHRGGSEWLKDLPHFLGEATGPCTKVQGPLSPLLPASPRKQGAGLGPLPPPSPASQPPPTSHLPVSTESTGSLQPAPGPPGIVFRNLTGTLAFVSPISQLRSPQF